MKEQNPNKTTKKKKQDTKHMSVKSILGGDILANDFFKRQTKTSTIFRIDSTGISS